MRRAGASEGLLVCFVFNLILNFEWGAAAAVLYLLHRWLELPLFLAGGALAVWLLYASAVTILVKWGNGLSRIPRPCPQNKNPYSARNDLIFPSDAPKPEGKGQTSEANP